MNKEKCCYPNCFECPFSDCVNDELFDIERKEQNEHDREILYYRKDNKGKADYLRLKRYLQSDKGKELQKRKQEKRIKSGKNAESCRRYREKKKMEAMMLLLNS